MFDVHLPEVEAVCGLDDAGLVDVMRDAVNFPPLIARAVWAARLA
jgi:hypothetical protein